MARQQRPYDDDAIRTLDPLQHIRLRYGMYIGHLGDGADPSDGVYMLMKEIIDNSIDEFSLGYGRRIDITRNGSTVAVRDYGRGIPLGKVIDCVSKMNTGGKYNADVYQFSVGLNGVGTKAVNALSSRFEVISYRDGRFKRGVFEHGKLIDEEGGKTTDQPDGTWVEFTPDVAIFTLYAFHDEHIHKRLRYGAFLNAGLTLTYNGHTFCSKNGLRDLLAAELGEEGTTYEPYHFMCDRVEFTFTHTGAYGENAFSFVNGQYTNDGGTHQSAFLEGVLKGLNAFSSKGFVGDDLRGGFVGAIAIRIQEPSFESQTKTKLTSDVRAWVVGAVKPAVERWLHTNVDAARRLLNKIQDNERLRTELTKIRKESRARAKSVAVRIPKLTDCKVHFTKKEERRHNETCLFITEGDSAGGSMVQCRDVETQAIFCIRGKLRNCYNLGKDEIYKNQELYNLMSALGIENGLDGLRYNKVIIATDADHDGMHIRNLLLTYFLQYFDALVIHGHVHILDTPLFRVRNRQVTRYCYSEHERDEARVALSGNEVTRFKGLGEISPGEFGQFIGADIRLTRVEIPSASEVRKTLHFYMAENRAVPDRKAFILQNLILDDT